MYFDVDHYVPPSTTLLLEVEDMYQAQEATNVLGRPVTGVLTYAYSHYEASSFVSAFVQD